MFAKRLIQITLILAVLVAGFAMPRIASAAGPCGSIYIVRPGDWLSKIANRCGVTLSALYAANPGVAYQRYIYPGQALNIPSAPVYQPPYYPPYYPPYQPYVPPSGAKISVAPSVGGRYFWTMASVGNEVDYLATVRNTGTIPVQVVANLTPPDGWEYVNNYNNCPDTLAVGSSCTYTWIFVPQVSGNVYIRIYVRGIYTDYYGNPARAIASSAYLFVVP